MTPWIVLQAAGSSASIELTDQGFFAFCAILIVIFGAEFAMIRSESGERQRFREEFVEFRATVLAELRAAARAKFVGVANALDVLSEPNPWTDAEMRIRNRMRQNPDFDSITDSEIEIIIRRLDAERAEGALTGDKLMAADYMLRELNGELARRREARAQTPTVLGRRRWPWSKAS